MTNTHKPTGKSAGGFARAEKISSERRLEISKMATAAKRELASLPKVTHESGDHPLKIGDTELACYVLSNGQRVLSQRGMQIGIGMSAGGGKDGEQRLGAFALSIAEKSINISELHARAVDLSEKLRDPIKFNPGSGRPAYGYEATVLADLCDVILGARANGLLQRQQAHIGVQAEILVRGFARVGIIALVDEATGYQKERAKDALAKVLEAWVAKELRPYMKTFPVEFYEELFRLRGLEYPPERQNYRPQYFGLLTNDIVYERLAPGLLEEMKRQALKDEKRRHLHRRLTTEVGYPRLKEHLASVITMMKLSEDYPDFILKLNRIHPRFGDTYTLSLDDTDR